MTFNEANVNRRDNGEFGNKLGSNPEIGLSDPVAALDIPRDVDFLEAASDARHSIAWELGVDYGDPSIIPIISHPDYVARIERSAGRIARESAPLRAMEANLDHPADEQLEEIWAGHAPGYSEKFVKDELRRLEEMRLDLAERRIEPSDVIGTGFNGNARKRANDYLHERENTMQRAINTHGRSLRTNVANALATLRREDMNGEAV